MNASPHSKPMGRAVARRPYAPPRPDRDALLNLSRRVETLTVSHRDPERFFAERSEIADALRRMAREARLG